MEDASRPLRQIGHALSEYLQGAQSFAELEAAMAEATRSFPAASHVFRRLYHVVNHYEIDRPLREQDASYGSSTRAKLDNIARCLNSGSEEEVAAALEAFWRTNS